jgi:hypothetical protein
MGEIENRGTLVCSINVSDLDLDPGGNPLTLAGPNQPAQAGK